MKNSKKKDLMRLILIVGLFSILLISIFPLVSAVDLTIEKKSSDEVYIKSLGKPIYFDLSITNNGASDSFEFYNLMGFTMLPAEKISIDSGETKDIRLEIFPIGEIPESGFYALTYYIKDRNSQIEGTLLFKIISLKEAFVVGSDDIDIESSSIEVFIKNLENVDFENMKVKFTSPFFDIEKSFSLDAKETEKFTVSLDKEDFRELTAGFYTVVATVEANDEIAEVSGIVRFVEKNIVTTTKSDIGFFVNTKIIEKKNEGNLVEESETVIKKNIVSRLFTTFNPEPNLVEREGMNVYYTWISEVRPGETYKITVRTNWFFPFLIILLLVAIVILVKQYTGTDFVLRKKVSFVKAKGGEFALKVSLFVNAKKYVERVNIIDSLPSLVELYERFGGDAPSKIDKKNKRIEWNFEKLQPGETRVLSYIIYSKVGVLGKFALPTARAIYEKEGEIHETESNRAFFVADQISKPIEE